MRVLENIEVDYNEEFESSEGKDSCQDMAS